MRRIFWFAAVLICLIANPAKAFQSTKPEELIFKRMSGEYRNLQSEFASLPLEIPAQNPTSSPPDTPPDSSIAPAQMPEITATRTPRVTPIPSEESPPTDPRFLQSMILFGLLSVLVVLIGVWLNWGRINLR